MRARKAGDSNDRSEESKNKKWYLQPQGREKQVGKKHGTSRHDQSDNSESIYRIMATNLFNVREIYRMPNAVICTPKYDLLIEK
ncbi:hypothetical protein [Novipirellula sp.]|uniref:hypothetical protein n=1 Tax=Novipirellula sp. TaxID=2795430 RepID=UPI003567037A